MASATTAPLADRADIHKSCKCLETLVNSLNDYCEAVSSIFALQKKLARALREAASLKTTGEIASNAMNASATIFEVLSDIDTKFAKYSNKEYDGISTEVRKWFKKLAKEEKAHDERLSSANARIKQAGQTYEKKSKKNARDAGEEHARYINLISTLGPEISQEKYNHAASITHKHTATTYSVAACVSRVADAEWLRNCEGVRRFAPTIGTLGEWRVFCESGWMKGLPGDLLDVEAEDGDRVGHGERDGENDDSATEVSIRPRPARDQSPERGGHEVEDSTIGRAAKKDAAPIKPATHLTTPADRDRDSSRDSSSNKGSSRPTSVNAVGNPQQDAHMPRSTANEAPSLSGSGVLPESHRPLQSQQSYEQPPSYNPSSDRLQPQPAPTSAKDSIENFQTLSSFPAPPTHFPIPPQRMRYPSLTQSSFLPRTDVIPRKAPPPDNSGSSSPTLSHSDSQSQHIDQTGVGSGFGRVSDTLHWDNEQPIHSPPDPRQTLSSPPPSLVPDFYPNTSVRGDYFPEGNEFGVVRHPPGDRYGYTSGGGASGSGGEGDNSKAASMTDAMRSNIGPRRVERNPSITTNTTGGGSIVAAMRNRYSFNAGNTSPPPREIPRLPLSVSDLASKYQPQDADHDHPASPRRRMTSPVNTEIDRQLSALDTTPFPKPSVYSSSPVSSSGHGTGSAYGGVVNEDHERQQQEQERQQQQERGRDTDESRANMDMLRQREVELREREREIEEKTRQLQLDRANLFSGRGRPNQVDSDRSRDGGAQPAQYQPHHQQRQSIEPDRSPPIHRSVTSQPKFEFPTARPYSYSATHLVPPAPSDTRPSHSRSPSPSSRAEREEYYNDVGPLPSSMRPPPSPRSPPVLGGNDRQPQQPSSSSLRPEKDKDKTGGGGKGWMRRLSMPVVGNAFLSEAKKGGTTRGGAVGVQEDGRINGPGRGKTSLDIAMGNRSTTNLGRR